MEALTKSLSEEKTTAEANLKKYELATKLREENIDVRFLDFLPLDADPKETEEKINVIKDILDSYAVKILQGDMINNPRMVDLHQSNLPKASLKKWLESNLKGGE